MSSRMSDFDQSLKVQMHRKAAGNRLKIQLDRLDRQAQRRKASIERNTHFVHGELTGLSRARRRSLPANILKRDLDLEAMRSVSPRVHHLATDEPVIPRLRTPVHTRDEPPAKPSNKESYNALIKKHKKRQQVEELRRCAQDGSLTGPDYVSTSKNSFATVGSTQKDKCRVKDIDNEIHEKSSSTLPPVEGAIDVSKSKDDNNNESGVFNPRGRRGSEMIILKSQDLFGTPRTNAPRTRIADDGSRINVTETSLRCDTDLINSVTTPEPTLGTGEDATDSTASINEPSRPKEPSSLVELTPVITSQKFVPTASSSDNELQDEELSNVILKTYDKNNTSSDKSGSTEEAPPNEENIDKVAKLLTKTMIFGGVKNEPSKLREVVHKVIQKRRRTQKLWDDVRKCRYLRGYDPPDIVVPKNVNINDFVFGRDNKDNGSPRGRENANHGDHKMAATGSSTVVHSRERGRSERLLKKRSFHKSSKALMKFT